MQYMIVFKQASSDFETRDDSAYMGAWGAYIGAIRASGITLSGHGLMPPATGTSVRVRDGRREVQDGPYADTKEHLGGYFIVDVPSLDVALEWAARAPCAQTGSVEVRPVMPPMPMPAA